MKQNIIATALIFGLAAANPKDGMLNSEPAPFHSREARLDRISKAVKGKSSDEEGTAEERFLKWVSKNNRAYKDDEDYATHKKNWLATDAAIRETNLAAEQSQDPNALKLRHNKFSDMTSEEAKKYMGRAHQDGGRRLGAEAVANFEPRELAVGDSVDWRAAGKTVAVKDQGNCGSCYAFSGNTALEAAIAIAEGTSPVHLSEQ